MSSACQVSPPEKRCSGRPTLGVVFNFVSPPPRPRCSFLDLPLHHRQIQFQPRRCQTLHPHSLCANKPLGSPRRLLSFAYFYFVRCVWRLETRRKEDLIAPVKAASLSSHRQPFRKLDKTASRCCCHNHHHPHHHHRPRQE